VDLYVARQPILDRSRRTYAHELLFRDGLVNAFGAEDPDLATARVIDTSFFVLGIETLTGGRKAFVMLAWERGAWDEVSLAAARIGLRSEEIAARYKSALEFGNSVALVEGGRPARV